MSLLAKSKGEVTYKELSTLHKWALVVLIAVSLILAATLEWVEALACALAGVVALVLAAARVAWKSPHVVSIRVPNERIVAGQTAVGEILVRNERARPVGRDVPDLLASPRPHQRRPGPRRAL